MSIVVNGISKGNFIANNKQLQKVYANGILVWENWKPWSDGKSNSWDGYPSSPQSVSLATGGNIRVQNVSVVCSKAYVDGEYGHPMLYAFYSGSWHELARGNPGFSESSCSWSGDLICEQLMAQFNFQVCRSISISIKASGVKKGN